MSVNLSPLGGAGAQFFTNDGVPLTGGLLYTYQAGSTTPATTYTSGSGITALANPIILDAAGRVPTGEIWLTDGISYKFVLKDSTDVLIATWDGLSGINSNFIAYTSQEETATATAGQTVFNLSLSYIVGANSLAVYVNGSNQVVSVNYLETDDNTVTFLTGLNVGDVVKFSTATPVATNAVDAANVSYTPAGASAVTTNVQAKLRETVSVKDFGAVGDGATDDTDAINNALATGKSVYFPNGTYNISDELIPSANQLIYGSGQQDSIIRQTTASANGFTITSKSWIYIQQLSVTSNAVTPTGAAISITGGGNNFITDVKVGAFNKGCLFTSTGTLTVNNVYCSGNSSHGFHLNSTGVQSVGIWISNSYSLVNGGNGLLIEGSNDGLYLDTLELSANTANGFEAVTDGTGTPSHLFCSKIVCDSNAQSGFLIGASVNASFFNDCWSSNQGSGHNFYCQGTDIQVIGGKMYNSYGHGMQFLTGTRCSVVGTSIQDCGSNTANTYDGIHSSMSGLVVSGVTVFSGANKTRYGIYLNTGASNTTITGCNLTGNVSGGLYNASTSTDIYISNCIGSGANNTTSWTPVIDFQSGAVGSFTYTVQTGNSTRNGNMVFCDFDISWSGSPTAGAIARISGFPIAINTVASAVGVVGGVKGITFNPTVGSGTGTMIAVDSYDTTHVRIAVSGSGLSFTDAGLNGTGFGGVGGSISGTFSYLAA